LGHGNGPAGTSGKAARPSRVRVRANACAITAFIGVVALGSVVVLARRWSAATGMA
jgi:hypothetical protein